MLTLEGKKKLIKTESFPFIVQETEEELIKVNQAIDAVSSVNDPESTANRRKKKLMIRKRRADILRKKASMVVVTKRKAKKSLPRDSKVKSSENGANLITQFM